MSSHDDFTATVGVALIESAGLLPWTTPLPPALAGARGWLAPAGAEPAAVFVLPADKLDGEATTTAVAAWRAWLADQRLGDAILLLVTADAGDDAELRGEWAHDARWQPWQVDLASRRIDRPVVEDGADAGFAQAVDAAVMAYFQGPAMTLVDLAEEEQDRLAGKPPFLAWIDAQPAPASYLLLGLVVGLYAIAALNTAGALGLPLARTPYEALAYIGEGLQSPSAVALVALGASMRPLIEQGEVWRILAANYLHGNLLHVLVTALSIAMMAPTIEKLFGTPKFLAIWVFAGAAGAAASAAINRDAISVGASGALFGLLGAMLALGARFRGAIPSHHVRALRHIALMVLGFNLVLGATIPRVDNVAHLGGLAGGVAMAFLLGPHPDLMARRRTFWSGTALWIFPLLAAACVATGLAGAAVGRMPDVPYAGPTRDYAVSLPIDVPVDRGNQYLIARGPRADHFVLVDSLPNPDPTLVEVALEARAYDVARRYATQGARLVDSPVVVAGGHHRFLRVPVALPERAREEIHVTASATRVYAIRTRGLTTDPWVRATRDHMLATFRITSP